MLHQLLTDKFIYYTQLSEIGKQKFINRVEYFRREKRFVGKEGLVISQEIEYFISAAAVQLTFGISDYSISRLHTIFVYPGAFYSRLYENDFKGYATPSGTLSLSWEHLKSGYQNPNNKINLGLHELTHALHIDLDTDGNRDEQFSVFYDRWKTFAPRYMALVKIGHLKFLRNYGSKNIYEFLAVCVETFFEAPEEFKRNTPELYGFLAVMLNQDPMNKHRDYAINEYQIIGKIEAVSEDDTGNYGVSEKDSWNFKVKKYGEDVLTTVLIAAWFVGLPLVIVMSSKLGLTTIDFISLYGVGAVLGFAQWNYLREGIAVSLKLFSVYVFTGFSIWFLFLAISANYLITIDKREEVVQINRWYRYQGDLALVYLNNRGLEDVFFYKGQLSEVSDIQLKLSYNKGLLGYEYVSEVEIE